MSTPLLWEAFALHWKLFPFNKKFPIIFDIKNKQMLCNDWNLVIFGLPNYLFVVFFITIPPLLHYYFQIPNAQDNNPSFVLFIFFFQTLLTILTASLELIVLITARN